MIVAEQTGTKMSTFLSQYTQTFSTIICLTFQVFDKFQVTRSREKLAGIALIEQISAIFLFATCFNIFNMLLTAILK